MKEDKTLICDIWGVRYLQGGPFRTPFEACTYFPINGKTIERAVHLPYYMIYVYKTAETYSMYEKNSLLGATTDDRTALFNKAETGWLNAHSGATPSSKRALKSSVIRYGNCST